LSRGAGIANRNPHKTKVFSPGTLPVCLKAFKPGLWS
jgi:hypothetical protein